MAKKKSQIYTTESGDVVHGIMAEFDTPATVYKAAEKIRDAGYTVWDVHTPFPIHGMEDAMGIQPTKLPLIVAVCGFSGVAAAVGMQWWTNYIDYQMVVQGKPFDAWEPLVPVTFELGVLFAAFSAVFGMLALNFLPMHYHPLFKKDRFLKVSDDRFIICIEANDEKFDPQTTRQLLESAGGTHIDLVED